MKKERPGMARLVACARQILGNDVDELVSETEFAEKIEEVLHGPKQVWPAAEGGLIRQREAAEVVAAHLESWIVDRGGRSWSARDPAISTDVIDRLEAAIFGAK